MHENKTRKTVKVVTACLSSTHFILKKGTYAFFKGYKKRKKYTQTIKQHKKSQKKKKKFKFRFLFFLKGCVLKEVSCATIRLKVSNNEFIFLLR